MNGNLTKAKIQESEKAQLLQTVEMFEAVTQANPEDYQSLEILKEAYYKLGREADSLRVAKQIALAHLGLGQVSQAVLQYEGILQKYPNDAEAKAALAELRAKATALDPSRGDPGRDGKPVPSSTAEPAEDKESEKLLGDLMGKRLSRSHHDTADRDGDEVLCDLIVKYGLLKEKDVKEVLNGVQGHNSQLNSETIRLTLVQALSDRGLLSPEQTIAFISERTNLAYMPLSIYDVVADIVRLQPRDISFKFCTFPFDRISRTLLMATANPFDERAKKAAEKVLDYNLQWYACHPQEMSQILNDVYNVGKAAAKDD